MIPEQRPAHVVDHVVHLAILTGEPVELRDDELADLDRRWCDPFTRMQDAIETMRATIDRAVEILTDVELPAPPEPEPLTLAELRLHDLAVAQDRVKGWSGPGDRQAELAETVKGWLA